jgi:hypothetical protein
VLQSVAGFSLRPNPAVCITTPVLSPALPDGAFFVGPLCHAADLLLDVHQVLVRAGSVRPFRPRMLHQRNTQYLSLALGELHGRNLASALG